MKKDILDITSKISDIETLQSLKNELLEENININEILEKYITKYNENINIKKQSYQVNFGHNRSITDFQNNIEKMKPCSMPQNYRETTIKAKGQWRDIYEIAFGSNETTITTIKPEEKNKQRIFKEAA